MAGFNKSAYSGLSYQWSGLTLNKPGTFIQMPQRAKFTLLFPMDTVWLPSETQFPREEALLGYMSANPQKENEGRGDKKR